MSQEGGGGGDHGDDRGSFGWDAQPWSFSNSDNSGGSEQIKPEKNLLESRSNSPTCPKGEKKGQKTGGGAKGSSSKGRGGGESDHEMHIWTERERRKKMRNMFSCLHALLPHVPAKADKSTIVDEAVNYIKTLQQTLKGLEKQKLERIPRGVAAPFDGPSPSMAPPQSQAMMGSREAFMADQGKSWGAAPAMNSPTAVSIPRLANSFRTWSSPNVVLNVSGEDAHISVCAARRPGVLSTIFYVMEKHGLEVVSAHVSSDYFRSMYMIHAHASGVSDQFPETLMIEEIFKLAVGEMIGWLS